MLKLIMAYKAHYQWTPGSNLKKTAQSITILQCFFHDKIQAEIIIIMCPLENGHMITKWFIETPNLITQICNVEPFNYFWVFLAFTNVYNCAITKQCFGGTVSSSYSSSSRLSKIIILTLANVIVNNSKISSVIQPKRFHHKIHHATFKYTGHSNKTYDTMMNSLSKK